MRTALKWGIVTGVATYVLVGLALTAIGLVAFGNAPADLNANPGKLTLGCFGIFLLLFAFSAAGYFTGRETGVAGQGALAGAIACALYVALFAVYVPGSAPFSARGAETGDPAAIAAAIVAVIIYIAAGALMGWLGGRPGAARARTSAVRKE